MQLLAIRRVAVAFVLASAGLNSFPVSALEEFISHAPARPLPRASARVVADGPAKFVDGSRGNDSNPGTKEAPWKTLAHAVGQLQPGDTLYLRGGLYFERVTTTLVGAADKPITIRAYPDEFVTLDGGIPEFQLAPASAWEPCTDGVAGEFQSKQTYPGLEQTTGELRVSLLGNFVDSLLPLQGYWSRGDLQSDNPYWNLNDKTGGASGSEPGASATGEKRTREHVADNRHVYCGPGVWYNADTDRIHCRLAHTKLPGLGDNNYHGETDPRKVPLVIAPLPHGPVLTLKNSRYVRLQDLVFRGARTETLAVEDGGNIELEGLTLYGGAACLKASGVRGLRVSHTACRGLASPWTFRGSLKYRSIESRIIRTGGWDPSGNDGRDYEFAYCEFTDSVDGVFIGNIHHVAIQHSLVENISDDAIFVTANTGFDGETHGGGHLVAYNRFAHNLTCFASGVGHGRQKTIADGEKKSQQKKQLGGGLLITRNVFDFRHPVMYRWPTGPDDVQELNSLGRMAGDHGSPAWEPVEIVHNTFLTGDPPRYEYGTNGMTGAMGFGTRRRIYNNIIAQLNGLPGSYFPPGDVDYAADANLLWSWSEGTTVSELPKPRYSRDMVPPRPEWGAHDKFTDPKFVRFDSDWHKPVDLHLRDNSPAVDAGLDLPPTTLPVQCTLTAAVDQGKPDLGAVPLGAAAPRVGCYGRLDIFGNPVGPVPPAGLEIATSNTAGRTGPTPAIEWQLPRVPDAELPRTSGKPAVVVTGYPAFDAPVALFALRKRGVPVDFIDKAWLDPKEYHKYGLVIVDGSFTRGRITPDRYSDADLPYVKKFLEEGGTLWLFRERADLFADPAAKTMLYEWTGGAPGDRSTDLKLRAPGHPWIKHLGPETDLTQLARGGGTYSITRGEILIGTPLTRAALGRVPVSKGQIIFFSLSPGNAVPNGRTKSTEADEKRFSDQVQIVTNIVEDLYPTK
jgi:hypothetical protein